MQEEIKNSYLPLFRKYRPQSFKDVIGQDFTVQALSNAIKLNKIANAYLFCGPRGTGKTSSARIFAKSLNCEIGPTTEPCQKCQSCLDVTNASGIDVIEIDAATNRGIDDARELINQVQYAPMNGKYKIFIIDEVHMLSKEAFNALLKTFEEPPKNVIFILATTEPHKVIETIVSRCQRFDFRRITIDDIVKRLKEISALEKINITDEALYAIAKNVSGGMRDSLALLDQASILGIEKQITKETIESLIGKLTFDVLYDLLNSILKEDTKDAVQKLEKIYEKGSEPRNFVENFIEFLRNTIIAITSKELKTISELTLIDQENIQKIKENTYFTKEKLVQILDKTVEFYKEIKTSTNPYLWAELMVIDLASIDSINASKKITPTNANTMIKTVVEKKEAPVQPQVAKIEQEVIKKEVKTVEEVQTEEPVQVKEKQVQSTNIENPAEIWNKVVNSIDSILAKCFYSSVGKLINVANNKITLGFVNENALSQAKSDNKYKPLMSAVEKVLGSGASIEFVIVTSSTKVIDVKINPVQNAPQKPKPQFQSKAPVSEITTTEKQELPKDEEDESIKEDENYTTATKEMLETFGGRVIE